MLRRVVPALLLFLAAGAAPGSPSGEGAEAPAAETLSREADASLAALAAELGFGTAGATGTAPGVPVPPSPPPCRVRDPEDGRCYASADEADLAWLARGSRGAAGAEEDDEEEGLEAAEPAGFWRSLGDRVWSLVVRRSDGRPVAIPEEEIAALFSTTFPIPVGLYDPARLRDTFLSRRGKGKKHHAIDLGAPRGTPVVAVADGVIERLGRDRRGGKVVYLRDTTGRYTFYYAHLRVHAKGLKSGDRVVKGQELGEVGATGRVVGGPHLHFAIYRNEPATDSRLFAVNPYLIFSTILPR